MTGEAIKAVRDAERGAQAQRIVAGRWLKVDETKVTSSADQRLLRRVTAAAAEQSVAFDQMLQDRDVNRLFNAGALFFSPD